MTQVLAVLQEGLNSTEHGAFVHGSPHSNHEYLLPEIDAFVRVVRNEMIFNMSKFLSLEVLIFSLDKLVKSRLLSPDKDIRYCETDNRGIDLG